MRRITIFDQLVGFLKIHHKLAEWISLIAIVVLGVFLIEIAQSRFFSIEADGIAYITHAMRVSEGKGIFERRGPFFQLLLITAFKAFGTRFESAVLVPQFFGSLIPILLFLVGKSFFDSKTGLIAALIGALNPLLINLSGSWVLRETVSLAFILMLILTAHFAVRIRSRKKRIAANVLPGLLSGLLILTREEFIFVIPLAYMLYIYLHNKKRLDFVVGGVVFLATTMIVITPWLIYSYQHFGDPFYSYVIYIRGGAQAVGDGGDDAADMGIIGFVTRLVAGIPLGLWKGITQIPRILSVFGFVFLPVGVMFTIRNRAVWIIYIIIMFELLFLSPLLWQEVQLYQIQMPYSWIDPARIPFSAIMPATVIAAYGITRFLRLLSDLER